MIKYIALRLFHTIFVIIGITIIVFTLVKLSGDPVLIMLSGTGATEKDLIELRKELGLDKPNVVQYLDYIGKLMIGDFGESIRFKRPALELVLERFVPTLILTLSSLFFSIILAVPIGIISAIFRNSIIDYICMFFALIGQSIPLYWLGIVLIMFFSVYLGWVPVSGYGSMSHLILPTITLGLSPMARIARLTRSSMLEVLGQDYIITANAKGLSNYTVIIVHALKNASLPVVTIIGLMFGTLLGGAVITETIFTWPGVGLLTIQAIKNRDYTLVQASVLLVSVSFVFINLLVDILYTILDPRIKYTN